jgi:hypothetical protein
MQEVGGTGCLKTDIGRRLRPEDSSKMHIAAETEGGRRWQKAEYGNRRRSRHWQKAALRGKGQKEGGTLQEAVGRRRREADDGKRLTV